MPYLTEENKKLLELTMPSTAGELNYCLTMTCLNFLNNTEGKYNDYNTIVGALESCKLEFYRRGVARYEDKKIKENGDVYES